MRLSQLCDLCKSHVIERKGDCEVKELCMDNRVIREGELFFCISGARFDAHKFAPGAVEKGACALVVERFLELDVPQVLVKNTRKAMTDMAAAFFGYPAREMKMLGVTGTKGKTTTTYLIKAIMEAAGMKSGLIGTTGNMIGNEYLHSEFTTPEPIDLHRTLRLMADRGVKAVTMEVSAHAIEMGRLEHVHFDAGCYTNLSQDHLDLFGNMENYFLAKSCAALYTAS